VSRKLVGVCLEPFANAVDEFCRFSPVVDAFVASVSVESCAEERTALEISLQNLDSVMGQVAEAVGNQRIGESE
jgi:hypothetical protein